MKLTANRVVLILHIILAVLGTAGAYIVAASNSLPHSWGPALALAVIVLGFITAITATVLKFLDGSQKYDALTARGSQAQPALLPAQVGTVSDQQKTMSVLLGQQKMMSAILDRLDQLEQPAQWEDVGTAPDAAAPVEPAASEQDASADSQLAQAWGDGIDADYKPNAAGFPDPSPEPEEAIAPLDDAPQGRVQQL